MESADNTFWAGPDNPWRYIIYKMNSASAEHMWYQAADGTKLDPEHSEFSVRIHDPDVHQSLSFINRTIAILPKSRLKTIHALIGRYLDEVD